MATDVSPVLSDFVPDPLERSVSRESGASVKSERSHQSQRSHRSRTAGSGGARARKRVSRNSSRASSLAASDDKSLTSFPSFSPTSPNSLTDEQPYLSADAATNTTTSDHEIEIDDGRLGVAGPRPESSSSAMTTPTSKNALANGCDGMLPPPTMPEEFGSPALLPTASSSRDALFDDSPLLAATNVPGALHRSDEAHVQRLVARHGAVGLARLLAEDLATRDAQMAALRRRADARERALRKIIQECGLSSLELETRLRTVEAELRTGGGSGGDGDGGISELMSDAMGEEVGAGSRPGPGESDATIRAGGRSGNTGDPNKGGGVRGWKEFLWGSGKKTGRGGSRESSVGGDEDTGYPTVVLTPSVGAAKRPGLQDDLFHPPDSSRETLPNKSSSRSPSVAPTARKPSLASMALRLVAGGAISSREGGEYARGRPAGAARCSEPSTRSCSSGTVTSELSGPRTLAALRRNGQAPVSASAPRTAAALDDRRDPTRMGSPPTGSSSLSRRGSCGPVEMDTILPPDGRPPTLSHAYANHPGSEFLTDRFGFIYDQRRKKRQREAARMVSRARQGSLQEMLTDGRSHPAVAGAGAVAEVSSSSSIRSLQTSSSVGEDGTTSPDSTEDRRRWHDHLRIATFPTELLSHTPSASATTTTTTNEPTTLEAPEATVLPRSPSALRIKKRGVLPAAASTTFALDSEVCTARDGDSATAGAAAVAATATATAATAAAPGTLVKEDVEPVKLLLRQLGELHDALQRDKTALWNDFLRKVRAERHREGEAATAAAAARAAAEARSELPAVILPEAGLHDGEMIGVAGLGVKGKVGRAKWKEFKALVLGGIPVAYRAKIWAECTGASSMRVPGYYDGLVAQPASDDDAAVASQIEMDVHRTLTDNIFFRRGPGVAKLSEVLLAYARRNPEVGYCQGMNLIAANLLLVTPAAEDAFWILASVVENILPAGYYDHSLLASRADQQVLRQYVSAVLPRLSRHLDALGIELEALTFQWFLSVFTDCLSAEALFRVWDVVLCAGSDGGGGAAFLFRVALALLKLNEPQLLRCDSPAAAYTYINHQMTDHAISIDGLIHAAEALRRVVRREDVEARRNAVVAEERETARRREEEEAVQRRVDGRGRVRAGTSASGGSGSGSEGSGELVLLDPIPMDREE